MSAELQPLAAFQERVKEKLRDDIGSMLPDEALAALVQEAVKEQFFKPRKVEEGYRTVDKPSWFVEEVAKLAQPYIERVMREYVEVNRDALDRALAEFCGAQNLLLLAMASMRAATANDVFNMANQIVSQINR